MPSRPPLAAVVFDIDGVLLDSLPQHLAICRDLAAAYGLSLAIPDVAGMRALIAAGVTISPMLDFFRAVGFPEAEAARATACYNVDFMARYRPATFSGIDSMLAALQGHGFRLGLVTANIRANIAPALGASLGRFDPACQFFYDSAPVAQTKARQLTEGARRLGLDPAAVVYVGDQPSDARAAGEAGMPFLGVSYGWGLTGREGELELVAAVAEITPAILNQSARRGPRPQAV